MENICKFARTENAAGSINIINFVYERDAIFKQAFISSACYGIYLVTHGCGILHTASNDFDISDGDLFFTFSSKPYYIQNLGGLQYIYIGFIGLRVPSLFERLGIAYSLPVYKGFDCLREQWINDFENANEHNVDLVSEGLLLHSLSYLCGQDTELIKSRSSNGMLELKSYVDLHYAESDLNLKSISRKFNYSYKYVSNAFISLTRISFSSYLSSLRLTHARSLLENGMSSIQEVAYSSGFSDAQYFSKTFKKRYGVTPTEYRKKLRCTDTAP